MSEEDQNTEVLNALLAIPTLDVNPYDTNGMTPLARAVDCKRPPIQFIERLLADRRTLVDLCCQDGQTPLIIASRSGYSDIINMLIKAGADVNMPAPNGATAAFAAAVGGHSEALKLLIEKGADLELWGQNASLIDNLTSSIKEIVKDKGGFAILMTEDVNENISYQK